MRPDDTTRSMFALFSALIFFGSFISAYSAGVDLYGSSCSLEDGTMGICKKLPECPSRVQEVRQGRRNLYSGGRCGFEGFIEIVCCPLNITDKIGMRPSEVACRQYDNEVSSTNFVSGDITLNIFGGTEAEEGEFPYMVALGYTKIEGDEETDLPLKYMCGGTLISDRHVLTAAHCVSNVHERVPVMARLGNTNLRNNTETAQYIEIEDINHHPKYKRSVNYNDVAILKLKKPVRMNEAIRPICLQTKELPKIEPAAQVSFIVIGFGSTSFDVEFSTKLMKTPALSLVDQKTCKVQYSNFAKLPRGLDETMLCALDENTRRRADGCTGDSGGPLLMFSQDGHTIVGVTAFGQTCGSSIPGIYTSVYSYLDWIEELVWPQVTLEDQDESYPGEFNDELRKESFKITIG